MLDFVDGWSRYTVPEYWWIHLMTIVWTLFVFILFVAKPMFLHRLFAKHVRTNPAKTFVLVQALHLFMLILSLAAVGGAVVGNRDRFPT